MNEYSTTESELDMGNDIDELLMKVQKLSSENDTLSKSLREKDHELNQKVSELNMENEKLKRSNTSLEDLVKTYKSASTGASFKNDIDELANQIADLENKLFLTEQSEQNLKRQNQALNMEISNLRIEIDKKSLTSKSESSALMKQSNTDEGLDNLDEETKALLTELMNQIEDLKKEKNEVEEKALNILTEKELENMEIREQLDEMKKKHSEEMNQLMKKIGDLKCESEEKDFAAIEDDDRQSINSEEAKELLNKYKELQYEYNDFKKEVEEREKIFIYENQKLKKDIEIIESTYKNNIQDLEVEIQKLKTEVNNNEMDRYQLEKEIHDDSDNKNMLLTEIENFQTQITHLEDMKEKSEFRYKEQIQQLQADLKELDQTNTSLRNQKNEIEKELLNLKSNSNKNFKEAQEKQKIEVMIKEKEIVQLKERIDFISRERETMIKDAEILKKNSEKTKHEYKELSETLKRIKENSENEIRRLEERYYILEKKMEGEKATLVEQNKDLKFKLNNALSGNKTTSGTNVSGRGSMVGEENKTAFSLSNMLESDAEDIDNKIILLQDEIAVLNGQILELNAKLRFQDKMKSESDILTKENFKLKNDIKEMKEMYEKQIQELQQKAMQIANELQTNKRRTTSKTSLRGEMSLSPKQMQILSDLENTISRMNAEHKFLNEKIEIMNKEIENLRLLRDNDVKFLREEVRAAEEQAINAKVSLATMAFEKDSELIKYKNLYKRLRMRIAAAQKGASQPILSKAHTVSGKK